MSPRSQAANRVAIVGYAHSAVQRRAGRPLGALAVDVAREAIADAALEPETIDGFVTAALFPTSGDPAVEDGVSIVSADWLAMHVGAAPRYAAGFQGIGQIPASVSLAVNAI